MLAKTIKSLPKSPGIYQFFDENGQLLYIGKAKRLNLRVKSYFKFTPILSPATNLSARISNMITQVNSINYLTVSTEHDALILENSLIKQLKPKYNILLRDDKTYPYLFVNFDDKFPRIELTRRVIKSKNVKYFGPYSSGARDLLESLYLVSPLVQKKGCIKGNKACLFYQIKRCHAPCEGKIDEKEYDKILQNALTYVHEPKSLIKSLNDKMNMYAENLNFEQAASIRDKIRKISQIEPKNHMDFARLENFDLLGIYEDEKVACGVRFFIRDGKIVSSSNFLSKSNNGFDVQSLYNQMLLSHYKQETPLTINKIYTAHELKDKKELEEVFFERFNKKVSIICPKIGDKRTLANIALENAKEYIQKNQKGKYEKIQEQLYKYFNLSSIPTQIETFDNSHLGGNATVGAIISWKDEGFYKQNYRHYHLKSKDEYAQMREILTHRAKRFHKLSPPDLWLIDGGKTLLDLASEIIKSSGANVDILAISKEKVDAKSHRAKGKAKDIIHSKNASYTLPTNDDKLLFLQRLRDEAHRFAISFHRKTKLKQVKESSTLKQKGLSEAKIKKLLLYYGSFKTIENAPHDDLCKLIGKRDAEKLKQHQIKSDI